MKLSTRLKKNVNVPWVNPVVSWSLEPLKFTVAFPNGLTDPVPLSEIGLPAVAAAITPLIFARLMLVVVCANAGKMAKRAAANRGTC